MKTGPDHQMTLPLSISTAPDLAEATLTSEMLIATIRQLVRSEWASNGASARREHHGRCSRPYQCKGARIIGARFARGSMNPVHDRAGHDWTFGRYTAQ
jgi:hypothetical protein